MSQYNRKQFNTTSKEVKKFCKVCQDAGKPESMYTSHFVRDRPGPDGKVVCPTLLSQNCRACGNPGHTYKYCKTVNAEKKQKDKNEENEKKWKNAEKKLEESVKAHPKKETVIKILNGAYSSILLSSSSDEDSDDDEPKDEQPKVVRAKTKVVSDQYKNVRFLEDDDAEPKQVVVPEKNPNSYAAKLMKPVPIIPKKEEIPQSLEKVVLQEPKVEQIGFKIVSLPRSTPKPVLRDEETTLDDFPIAKYTEPVSRVFTEEETAKINEGIKKIMNTKCSWDDDMDSSDDEEEEPQFFKKEEPVKTNVFIELKDAWSDDEA